MNAPNPGAERDHASLAAQRRQLTILFCDMVGSTPLSARLDPEDMHDIIRAYLSCCTDAIDECDGFVARYMGDGVLAYFGYPAAREDAPRLAIHAALRIRERVPRIPTPHGEPLAVRIGIATGVVVVGHLIGEGLARELSVVGEAPNLAARLQSAAAANTVLVSNATRRLAETPFQFREIGALALKGLTLQEPIWEAMGLETTTRRGGADQAASTSPVVGRADEMRLVAESWAARRSGHGQIVGLVGEPGIGKSRLLREVHRDIAREPHLWLAGGGAQMFNNTPFHAIAEMIRARVDPTGRLTPRERLTRLERLLEITGLDVAESAPLIAELIGIETPDNQPPITLAGDARRERLMSVLIDWLARGAQKWPTVLAIEDIQWVDPSTLELLAQLVGRATTTPFLMIYTARPGFTAPWPDGPGQRQIVLSRLDAAEVQRMISLTAGRDLPRDVLERVIARADGVPLFVEELARLIGRDSASDQLIPATLSDLLAARLDQPGPARELARIASVLGGEFGGGLLRAVSGLDPADMMSGLERLLTSNLIVEKAGSAEPTYAFRHALIQEAAYGSLLKSQRRSLHQQTARVIASKFPHVASASPEIIAHHWAGAGEPALAFDAWRDAGRLAVERKAYAEAQRFHDLAAAMLEEFAPSPSRDEQELALRTDQAGVLQITLGYSAPATVRATERARALAEKGGDLKQQCAQVAAMWMAASSGGDYRTAIKLADQFLPLAHAAGTPEELGGAHMMLMTSCYRTGDLRSAEEAFIRGRAHFASPLFHQRPGAVAQTFGNAALLAWLMGDSREADRRIALVTEHALVADNPYEQAFDRHMGAMMAVLMSRPEQGERWAREALAISTEIGFPQFVAISRVLLGRAETQLGRPISGLAGLQEGLALTEGVHSRNGRTMYKTWLAEAQAACDLIDDAVETLDEALSLNPQERFFRPEGLRLRGYFKGLRGDIEGAIADGLEAVKLAKSIGARTLHERAAATLAPLGDGVTL